MACPHPQSPPRHATPHPGKASDTAARTGDRAEFGLRGLRGAHVRLVLDTRGCRARPLAAVRLLLVADVLTRVLEQVLAGSVSIVTTGPAATTAAGVSSLARALNVGNLVVEAARSTDPVTGDGPGPTDLLLTTGTLDHPDPEAPAGRRLAIGGVHWAKQRNPSEAPDLHGREPLALRLALLRFVPTEPAQLSSARLNRAEETLDRWRFKVASWYEMPQRPAPTEVTSAMRDALARNLDTSGVLTMLHRLEADSATTSGAKYQVFTSLDRTLGLDLGRSIGRLRR